jgi:cyclopropane fatty-acyl-phospholipid synthase-like methyltransferase
MTLTLGTEYFARLYADSTDPWHFRERWYEKRKRALTLAALTKPRYVSAFEPGCSIGEFAAELATRCDVLLVSDVDPQACRSARQRLALFPHVQVARQSVPTEWPEASFDLIVISELAYYFDDTDLATLIARISTSLLQGGTLLACHWRHPVEDYPQTGDAVHARFERDLSLHHLLHHEEPDFLLDVWSNDGRSVAQREGLV